MEKNINGSISSSIVNGFKTDERSIEMKVDSERIRGVLVSILAAIMVAGCVAAIPVAVHYSSSDDKYVAVAEVEKDADELWLAVVRAAEKREGESAGEMKILKKDDSARRLEATDGVQTASVEVNPIGEKKSKVTVTADAPDEEGQEIDEEKELAALIMKALCDEAKADCEMTGQ